MNNIKVERTGRLYSFSGVEYIVHFPNGDVGLIWSPPWNDTMNEEEKDVGAVKYALHLWDTKEYKAKTKEEVETEFKRFFGDTEELRNFINKHFT